MSQQHNESQGYNEELQGATSTDAEQQSLVEQPVELTDDPPTDAEVAEEAAADSDAVPAADEDAVETDAAADEVARGRPPSPRRPTRCRSSARRCATRSATGSWCTPTPAWRTG